MLSPGKEHRSPAGGCLRGWGLLHKLVDGFAQVFDGFRVSGGDRVHNTVAHMVFQDDLAGVVQRRPDGCQLDEHLGAVISLLHHPAHLFQMTNGACQTVDDGFLVFVDMTVGMGDAVGVEIFMVVVIVAVMVFVFMVVIVAMIHGIPLLLIHYTPFFHHPQAPPGVPDAKIKGLTTLFLTSIMDGNTMNEGEFAMHIHEDHIGGGCHEHEHTHSHSHEHTHDGHTHSHEHLHDHGCGGDCHGCGSPCEHTPMDELLALMKYMVGHNAAHANELAELAVQLDKAGSHMAYEQVMAAVSDFEKGNMRLSTVLASLDVH